MAKLTEKIVVIVNYLGEYIPTIPERLREVYDRVRADPKSILKSRTFKIAAGGLGAVLALWIFFAIVGRLAGGPELGIDNTTVSVRVFDVVCENCHKSFTYKADIDFNDWPVKCPYCHHNSGYRAIRCPACDHLFMLPKDPNATVARCPYCGHIIKLRRR